MTEDQLLEEARAVAADIGRHRRLTSAGSAAWIGPTGYGSELIPLRTVQLGPHLYDGTAGIALFLAALEKVMGTGELRQASLEALAPLRRKLAELVAEPERAAPLRVPVGGLIGWGSFIYALVRIGQWLGEPELIREAHATTAFITPERIQEDRRVRVQTGCAGTILALLALHAEMPGPNSAGKAPLDLALECAEPLLSQRISFAGRPRAWALSTGKIPLAGFSYGAAGISYALLRLWEATGRPALREAASEGLGFVRGLYVPERRGWRDIRADFEARHRPRLGTWRDWWAVGTLDDVEEVQAAPAEDVFQDSWCHGAAGIALSRLGALHLEDGAEAREEIDGVLGRLQMYIADPRVGAEGPDDLCCGHMGTIELLIEAHRRLGDGGSLEAARTLLRRILERARSQGRFQVSAARGTDVFAPSLFQGVAGIGYTLLRLAEPEALPCLLLLE